MNVELAKKYGKLKAQAFILQVRIDSQLETTQDFNNEGGVISNELMKHWMREVQEQSTKVNELLNDVMEISKVS